MSSAHDFFRNRVRQLRNPSKRTPDRETTLNNADNTNANSKKTTTESGDS
jgi:hypothetical protein